MSMTIYDIYSFLFIIVYIVCIIILAYVSTVRVLCICRQQTG